MIIAEELKGYVKEENDSILQLAKRIGFYVARYDEFGEESACGNRSNRCMIIRKTFESFVNTKD